MIIENTPLVPTNSEQILELFRTINVWRRGDQRAPHKPLLILYALARLVSGKQGKIPYQEIDNALKPLLIQFGPPRKSYHPEHPFWWLQTDGLWELDIDPSKLTYRKGGNNPTKGELIKHDVHGGFPEYVVQQIKNNKTLACDIASEILENHFPTSMHDEILSAVGLDLLNIVVKRPARNPEFREKVLTAYEYRCSVCGFDVRIGTQPLGLEAAHVKWYQAGGPDTVDNGLTLCTLHHKIFDYGAFTIDPSEHRILVSEKAHGTEGFSEWLMRFHGLQIGEPVNPAYSINETFLRWHEREVFRGPGRHLQIGKL